jgi:hypothetical protein
MTTCDDMTTDSNHVASKQLVNNSWLQQLRFLYTIIYMQVCMTILFQAFTPHSPSPVRLDRSCRPRSPLSHPGSSPITYQTPVVLFPFVWAIVTDPSGTPGSSNW